jgi:hypothetical protein
MFREIETTDKCFRRTQEKKTTEFAFSRAWRPRRLVTAGPNLEARNGGTFSVLGDGE